ncbi:tyrosine-type recombinase/integrase [Streptomyces sp. NPDC002785]|uniref:tyrosine-type recombinase/integrase n=1 Tax=Streptomyces sp. NPDC002785 TaxID=3154543 RepID=UPI00331891E9
MGQGAQVAGRQLDVRKRHDGPSPSCCWSWRNTATAPARALHDLRHTAAKRMARDPELKLHEVQTILRHAHISTTELYTAVGLDDLLDKLGAYYARPVQPVSWPTQYAADDIEAVFGAGQ